MTLYSHKILSADSAKPTELEDADHISKVEIKTPEKKRKINFLKLNQNKPLAYGTFGILVAVILGWFIWFFFFQTHTEHLTLERGTWERKIGVESFEPRSRSGWSHPPSDAYNVNRDYRYHYSREVLDHYNIETYNCGTSSTPSMCTRSNPVYRTEAVYDWYYSYTIDRWGFDHWIVTSGDKSSIPTWADLSVYTFMDSKQIGNERLSGEREEDYDAYLKNEKNEEKHLDVKQNVWNHMQVGQTYTAEVNRVGVVRSVNWGL